MSDSAFTAARPWCRIDGSLRADVQTAVLACTAGGRIGEPAHAEVRLLNWGGRGGADAGFLFDSLQPGQTLTLGFGDDEVFTGDITAVEERYGGGAPQIVLLAEDALHRLARSRHSRSFEALSPAALLTQLAAAARLQADCNVDAPVATWHQLNESDLALLCRVLGRYDIEPWLDGTKLVARRPEAPTGTLALNAMDSAELRLIADLAQQPTAVEVRGYDLASGSEVRGSAHTLQPPPGAVTAAARLAALGWPGAEVFPQPAAGSQTDADGLAAAAFGRRAGAWVHGDMRLRGNPKLRRGGYVELSGVSKRFAGRYRMTGVWQSFDLTEGFRTRLKLERGDWNGS